MPYSMKTIYDGTKIRLYQNTHNPTTKTPTPELARVPAGVIVGGDEKWTALADGYEVKAGDVWLKVTYNGVTGWMAYIHKGQPICSNFKVVESTNPPPVATPSFPESYILENPKTGERAEYIFVKVL